MGAPIIEPIVDMQIQVLTLDEILRTSGQEVDISEVGFSDDGTILYQGRRVILHIRDISPYGGEVKLPKYHLTNCTTLQNMWAKKRSERYVVSTRHDGFFKIKISSDNGLWEDRESRLDVCKFCLTGLNWDNYASAKQKGSIFNSFKLQHFFERYQNSPISFRPTHTDVTAPINDYTKDFPDISLRYRESKNWKCESCLADLSKKELRRFLHVHHISGDKRVNNYDNLRSLCISCHEQQDNHTHLSNTPEYLEYQRLSVKR